jgi:DEAD/DEAH box helicase domain-containing protein
MSREIVFDIETRNTFHDVGRRDPSALDISVVSIWDSAENKFSSFVLETLDELWPILERATTLIGYNSEHFDTPLLDKYYPGNLYGLRQIDLMKTIQQSFGKRIGLDPVASATLGVQKSAHGLQAVEWWRNSEVDKIIKYCEQDVNVTKQLYEHMRDENFVLIPDILTGKTQKIVVDTSDWYSQSTEETGGMTIGFGF